MPNAKCKSSSVKPQISAPFIGCAPLDSRGRFKSSAKLNIDETASRLHFTKFSENKSILAIAEENLNRRQWLRLQQAQEPCFSKGFYVCKLTVGGYAEATQYSFVEFVRTVCSKLLTPIFNPQTSNFCLAFSLKPSRENCSGASPP